MAQEIVFHVFSVLILVMAVLFCLNGAMSLANALMAVAVSYTHLPPDRDEQLYGSDRRNF